MTSLELDDQENVELSGLEIHLDEPPPPIEQEPELALPPVAKKPHKRKKDSSTLRKAPQAPKRFKSSYICFFMAKQPEIKLELGEKATVTEISKRSAQMWRTLPTDERAHWDEVAAKDKQRYLMEKASYTGPWQVPWKRAKKDPSAPKRPMSAFLYYSQGRRREIKDANPALKNTEVSRLLGEMWRGAPVEEKRPFVEKEKEEREKYKVRIADWRKDHEAKQEKEKKDQEQQQAAWANMYQGQGDPRQQHPYQQAPPPSTYGEANSMYPPPPPPGPGYGYSYPAYPYPASSYQYPTNGKQPVILGPSGTPRYGAPMPPQYSSGGPPPPQPYGGGPTPSQPYSGGPPPPHQQQQLTPPPHHYGSPPQGLPPPQHVYEPQGHPPPHYEYPSPEQQQQVGVEHAHPPPPPYHQQQYQHPPPHPDHQHQE